MCLKHTHTYLWSLSKHRIPLLLSKCPVHSQHFLPSALVPAATADLFSVVGVRFLNVYLNANREADFTLLLPSSSHSSVLYFPMLLKTFLHHVRNLYAPTWSTMCLTQNVSIGFYVMLCSEMSMELDRLASPPSWFLEEKNCALVLRGKKELILIIYYSFVV